MEMQYKIAGVLLPFGVWNTIGFKFIILTVVRDKWEENVSCPELKLSFQEFLNEDS